MQTVYLRKYGEAATINTDLFEVDGVNFRTDATFAAGDVTVMKDEAVEANITTLPTDEGNGYSISLSATEMQAARIVVYLVDQTATKVWLDKSIVIETYGNASAQHAFDLDTASVAQTDDHTAAVAELRATQVVASGTADSGTTTTMVDAALGNVREGALLKFGSGGAAANVGVTVTITDVTGTTVTFSPAVTAITTETYEVLPANNGVLDTGSDNRVLVSTDDTQVQTSANAALVANHLDHIFAVDYDPAAKPGVATALFNELIESDGGVSRYTANALEQAPSGGDTTAKYGGPYGFGVYFDGGAANTNTILGTDGTFNNPVSSMTAVNTLATSLGANRMYMMNNSTATLAATQEDWEFIGFGENTFNVINLGSQDVDRSRFINLTIEGTQGGTQRIKAENCALQDPGPGTTALHIFAENCGIVDDITLDSSNDNVFIDCYSLVAGDSAPIIRSSGASGTTVMRGQKGGVDLHDLSASHVWTLEQVGQVIFDVSCNVNANVTLRGVGSKTDNTAGMNNVTEEAFINMTKINTEVDTAIADYAPNTVVPDAAGTAPTAVEIRTEIDSNSTQLNTTLPALIDDLAIKRNTAGVLHIEMVLASDHVTPATGLTVTSQRLIDSGTYQAVTGTMTEVSNGTYRFDYTAADSNGDTITWRFSAGTADDTKITFRTVQ